MTVSITHNDEITFCFCAQMCYISNSSGLISPNFAYVSCLQINYSDFPFISALCTPNKLASTMLNNNFIKTFLVFKYSTNINLASYLVQVVKCY
uniref:Uncharacterized protein n=1 Tax=Arundo donax TaxID=35708 RepID=A0A0A9KK29_ARUDO